MDGSSGRIHHTRRKYTIRVIPRWSLVFIHTNTHLQVWQTAGNGTRLVFVTAGNDDRDDDMDE